MEYPIIDNLVTAYLGNGWTGLEIETGKNILNPSSLTWIAGTLDDNGNLVPSSTSSYSYPIIPVEENIIYAIKGTLIDTGYQIRIYYFDINKNFISRSASFSIQSGNLFTTPVNCKYISIQKRNIETMDDWQIEKGNQSTTYEPFTVTKNTFTSKTKLPIIRFLPHPVIDSLEKFSSGTAANEDVQILNHYLAKFGIENIVLNRNRNRITKLKTITKDFVNPEDIPIKETKKIGEEDLNVKTE